MAIVLMLVHGLWATVVLPRKDARCIASFHWFGIVVWFIWLGPYFSPMFVPLVP